MKAIFIGKSTTWLPLLASVAVLLSACGQYGDLYLPDEEPTTQVQQQQVDKPQDIDKAQEQQSPQNP